MRLDGTPNGKTIAKALRRQLTPPEIALWLALRRNEAGLRFRKQHAVGNYILDFYCAPARLAIEVDGEAHNRGERPMRDLERDAWLTAKGLHILRHPAAEMLANLNDVTNQIIAVAQERRRKLES